MKDHSAVPLAVEPAVVLAAGAASRFGGPKQALLLPRVLERLAEAGITEIVVVQGAYRLDGVGVSRRVATSPPTCC